MNEPNEALDRIAAVLLAFDVRFVVVGGYALHIQDFDIGYLTEDIDLAVKNTAENFKALSAALKHLNARVVAGHNKDADTFEFDHTGETLRANTIWNLVCEHGRFDIATRYSPDMTYEDFAANSSPITIVIENAPFTIQVADVHDIIQSKNAANREKDRRTLQLLEAQLGQQTDESRDITP